MAASAPDGPPLVMSACEAPDIRARVRKKKKQTQKSCILSMQVEVQFEVNLIVKYVLHNNKLLIFSGNVA